jgi:hypothetical protein
MIQQDQPGFVVKPNRHTDRRLMVSGRHWRGQHRPEVIVHFRR